jgi:hypothetical protein
MHAARVRPAVTHGFYHALQDLTRRDRIPRQTKIAGDSAHVRRK